MTRYYSIVVPGIYVGTEDAPRDEELFDEYGINISCIIDLTSNIFSSGSSVRIIGRQINDKELSSVSDKQNLIDIIEELCINIHILMSENKNVLVHCEMGINRSPLVIGYYLMKYRKISYQETISLLEKANMSRGQPRTLTNASFRDILYKLEQDM